MILLVIKLLIKWQKFQKVHNKTIQRQLEMSIIKRYLQKDIHIYIYIYIYIYTKERHDIIDELRLE